MFDFYDWRLRAQQTSYSPRRAKNNLPRLASQPQIEILEERVVMTGVTAAYAVSEDWGSGFQARVSLQSAQPTAVVNWRLEFDYAANITSIWDAKVVSHVGTHYVITGAGWNNTLAAGGSVAFGFIASSSAPGSGTSAPAHYILNGVSLDGTATPPTPALPTISVLDAAVTEGNSGSVSAAFTAQLSKAATTPVVVSYTTQNGSATAGSDFTATSGKLTFAAGEISKTIRVAISPDTQVESDETFKLILSSPSGATLARATATGTIGNDDLPPVPPATAGDFQFKVSSDWGSGFTASVAAKNNTGQTLLGWTLSFDFAGQITSIWDATIQSHVGNRYVVTGASYNSSVAAGAVASFGFNGSRANASVVPTNFAWAGAANPDPNGPSSTPLPAGLAAWPAQFSAPYVDMGLYPMYDLATATRTQGIKFFTLAFVTADPQKNPAWGGFASYAVGSGEYDAQMKAQLTSVRALGGDAMVSFGGASGQELAEVITDPVLLKAAYQKVIDTYKFTHIDFDIEGAAQADRASIDRRSQAIASLQRDAATAGRTLDVWFTLPVLPTGLTADGLYSIQSALRSGVNIAGVNVMAMDYGDSAAPNPSGKMGDYAIAAGEATFGQLKSLYGAAKTDAQLWHMIGMTPMIGVNDIQSEVFDQQEARELVAWAEQRGIGRLSYWSLNRDQQSPRGALNYVELTSSSLLQTRYEFAKIFGRIEN